MDYGFLFRGNHRQLWLTLFDALCFLFVDVIYFLFAGKVNYSIPVDNVLVYIYNSITLVTFIFLMRTLFKIYKNIWRYTNTQAYFMLVVSDAIAGVIALVLGRFVFQFLFEGYYIGIWHCVTVASMTSMLTLMSRFSYRLLYKNLCMAGHKSEDGCAEKIRIAIVGAGQLGAYLVNGLLSSSDSKYDPIFFIDIDNAKIGKRISNLQVYSEDQAEFAIKENNITEVVFAFNDKSQTQTDELWHFYSDMGCKVKIYDTPLSDDYPDAEKKKFVIRDFAIEDLLFRKPLTINGKEEFEYYKEKTVLVTGGGGSIGGELCRQIAKSKPKRLVIFDIYENNAYEIEQELKRKYGEALELCVEIGSVRDRDRLECIFENYRPDIVFHAAAHKHVPLMEHSGAEAIKNNVLGTYNTADMAERFGTKKFILISTDKAVNPTNIMGASKRLCEMVIQCRKNSDTIFAAVRFGNVLGSNGSVIPLFKRQIENGGPITITDRRIVRYFMTIPEASQLVLCAGAKAQKGELFVLDMGRSVKIYDLAVNMIRLMGYVPHKDIEIKEIGLRPGEKLYEELLMKTEELDKTDNDMIFIERDTPLSREEVDKKVDILISAVERSKHSIDSSVVKEAIKATVPTFRDPEKVNFDAENSAEIKAAVSNEQVSLQEV